MPREIKFSLLLQEEDNGRIIEQIFDYAQIFSGHAKEHLNTCLKKFYVIARREYTGLKDKNGKDIYEGDIIDFKHHKGYLLDDCVGVMEWIVCEYVIKTSSFVKPVTIHLSIIDELQEDLLNHIEVIGSIYENPELITNTPSI